MREWNRLTWGEVSDLRYGKALRGYKDGNGATQVFGTNGPIGYTAEEPLAMGPRPVVGRKGAYRGVHLADGPFWVIDTAYWLVPRAGLDPVFAYYALLGVDINGMDSGSALPSLTRDHFYRVPLTLPPLEEQKRIAGVLRAFDDLIETNRRLIESLDQTATYRADQLANGAGGDSLKFADVADIGGGGTPSTKIDSYWGGVHPWATPKDITALPSRYIFDTTRKLTDAGLAKCSSPLRPVGSILMTSRATVGEFALAKVPLAVNQGFIVVNGETPADTTWLYFEMRRRTPEFKTIAAKGSTFPEISRREFRALDVHWPESRLRQQLHREVAPLLGGAAELESEVASLTAQRDELLPLLMSGKVRVRDVEAAVL